MPIRLCPLPAVREQAGRQQEENRLQLEQLKRLEVSIKCQCLCLDRVVIIMFIIVGN